MQKLLFSYFLTLIKNLCGQFHITIKIASEIGAQMKLRFVTLMLPMLNFGSNSVERSRSAVTMGIQSSDFVR